MLRHLFLLFLQVNSTDFPSIERTRARVVPAVVHVSRRTEMERTGPYSELPGVRDALRRFVFDTLPFTGNVGLDLENGKLLLTVNVHCARIGGPTTKVHLSLRVTIVPTSARGEVATAL